VNGHPQFDEDFDLYALGALEGEEKQPFETHLASCTDCRSKLEEARGRVALLTFAAPTVTPPPEVRERLLQKVRASRVTRREASRLLVLLRWLTPALALVCLFLLVALNFYRTENRDLTRRIGELRTAAEIQKAEYAHAQAVLDILTAPDTLRVTLVSGVSKPVPEGKAFYHPTKGLVFYAANLPALPSARTYQLWLVPAEGNPISAGVFLVDAHGNGAVLLPPLPQGIAAKAFAVTEEPAGGVPQPTGPKVLVGAVS
jgi:anti-sigma-K factor RskA